MPRPPLILGTWGRIHRAKLAEGRWSARARYRDSDGVTRLMERTGKTGAAAERALVEAMRERLTPSGEDLTGESRMRTLGRLWIAETESRGLAEGSVVRYRDALERLVLANLGDVLLREATVPRLDRFLKMLTTKHGPASAKLARVVLSGMFALAARHGAVSSNPVRDVAAVHSKRKAVTAPTLAIVHAMRAHLQEWDAGKDKRGQPRTTDLGNVADMFIATGARTGEIFGLAWDRLDLGVDPATVLIDRTVAQGLDGRLRVQEHPKSDASVRRLYLPAHVARMLLARRVDAQSEFVFPSSTGTFRSPNNFRTQWRAALLKTPWAGTTPRDFRKAVATYLSKEVDLDAAKEQLGHGSSAITVQHYIAQHHEGPDAASILERFFVESDE